MMSLKLHREEIQERHRLYCQQENSGKSIKELGYQQQPLSSDNSSAPTDYRRKQNIGGQDLT